MMASGFSWPSTSLVCSAEYTSLKLIGLGLQVGVGAELVGRKQLDVQPAPRGVADAIDRFLRTLVDRVRRVLAGGELVGELGRVGGARGDREQRQSGSAGQDLAAREMEL